MNNKQEHAGEELVQVHCLRGPEIFEFQKSLKNSDINKRHICMRKYQPIELILFSFDGV